MCALAVYPAYPCPRVLYFLLALCRKWSTIKEALLPSITAICTIIENRTDRLTPGLCHVAFLHFMMRSLSIRRLWRRKGNVRASEADMAHWVISVAFYW